MNIYKSVGMVSYLVNSTQRSFGTGTLVYKHRSPTTLSVFLITCKHVLPSKSQADVIYFDIANPKSPNKFSTVRVIVYDSVGNLYPEIKFDPDGNDLAVIDVTLAFGQQN